MYNSHIYMNQLQYCQEVLTYFILQIGSRHLGPTVFKKVYKIQLSLHMYWVPQKLAHIYTLIAFICIEKVA